MKSFLLAAVVLLSLSSQAQYYYKDIIGARESSGIIRSYQANKVSRVVLRSYNGTQLDTSFYVEQVFSGTSQSLRTITRSDVAGESVLTSYVRSDGNVIKTVDSSEQAVSTTEYRYDASGNLVLVSSYSTDSSGVDSEAEQHVWEWANGRPLRMLRIKDKKDTTFVNFLPDDKGNIIQEQETHRGVKAYAYQYYYNDNNYLTDIARFNPRTGLLLAEYLFEYQNDRLKQKITVPPNSSEYIIWVYQYNEQGLKVAEAVYNKHDKRTPMGKVVYQYFFGS